MPRYKVCLAFAELADVALDEFAVAIITGMTGNGVATATTLGNLRLLKEAHERAGREATELDRIINELSARDIEVRGENNLT